MRRGMDCVICGKYAQYVALSDGTCALFTDRDAEPRLGSGTRPEYMTTSRPRITSAIVKVVSGDPVCLEHPIRDMKHPNQFVRYARLEKLEPGRVLIDGVEALA